MPDDEIPPAQTMFYYKSYYEPTTGLHYEIRGDDGLWRGQKIPAILLDGPPSFGAGKGSRYAPMRKLRAKR